MKERAWTVKANLPRIWVVDCEWVGNGEKALIYLGRYLYRGVLLLRVCLPKPKEKPPLCCKQCGGVVTLTVIPYPRNRKPPDGPQATDRQMPL